MRTLWAIIIVCLIVLGAYFLKQNNLFDNNSNSLNVSSSNKSNFPVNVNHIIGKKSYDGNPLTRGSKYNQIIQDKVFPVSSIVSGSHIANISFGADGSLNSFFPTDNNIDSQAYNSDEDLVNNTSATTGADEPEKTKNKVHFKVFSGLDINVSEDTNSFTCPAEYPYVISYQLQRDDTNKVFTSSIYRNACFAGSGQDFDLLYGDAQIPSGNSAYRGGDISAFIPRGTPNSCNKGMLSAILPTPRNFIQVKGIGDNNKKIGLAQIKTNLNNSTCTSYCERVFDVICANDTGEKYYCRNQFSASFYKHNRYYAQNTEQYFCACEFKGVAGEYQFYSNSVVDVENIVKYKNLISSVTCGN
ncbi:MAG: hypothetical protein PHC75_01720 [Burkholderiales bacterium]|nr:hypothetical protein [Burkholderiales bacterium]